MLPKEKWSVKSHSDGEGDGYWEVVNEKGDGLKTTEDYEEIENELQKIADALNGFDGNIRVETALEINLHCNEQMAKMELDREKERSQKLVEALKEISETTYNFSDRATWMTMKSIASNALKQYKQ